MFLIENKLPIWAYKAVETQIWILPRPHVLYNFWGLFAEHLITRGCLCRKDKLDFDWITKNVFLFALPLSVNHDVENLESSHQLWKWSRCKISTFKIRWTKTQCRDQYRKDIGRPWKNFFLKGPQGFADVKCGHFDKYFVNTPTAIFSGLHQIPKETLFFHVPQFSNRIDFIALDNQNVFHMSSMLRREQKHVTPSRKKLRNIYRTRVLESIVTYLIRTKRLPESVLMVFYCFFKVFALWNTYF